MFSALTITALISTVPNALREAPTPQQKPKADADTVVIQGEAIVVPHLPLSTKQARAEQKALLRNLAKLRRSVEADMIGLYKHYTMERIPISIALPTEKYEMAETKLFLSILCGTTIGLQLNEMLNKWNSCQVALANLGYLHIKDRQSREIAKTIKPFELSQATIDKLEAMRPKLVPQVANRREETYRGQAVPRTDGRLGAAPPKIIVQPGNQRDVIVDSMAPSLSETWNLLMENLNGHIQKLAGLSASETVLRDADIKRLHDTATIVLFEQIRLALWICNNIWSRFTSFENSDPFKNLRVYSIQTQTDGNQNNGEVIVRQSTILKDHVILL